MEITIKDKTITLKYSFRSMIIYEKIMNESFKPHGVTQLVVYFYSVVMASSEGLSLTYDEWMDYLDANPKALSDFSLWLQSVYSTNEQMKEESEGEEGQGDSKKKPSTNS